MGNFKQEERTKKEIVRLNNLNTTKDCFDVLDFWGIVNKEERHRFITVCQLSDPGLKK